MMNLHQLRSLGLKLHSTMMQAGNTDTASKWQSTGHSRFTNSANISLGSMSSRQNSFSLLPLSMPCTAASTPPCITALLSSTIVSISQAGTAAHDYTYLIWAETPPHHQR
jgi:hypothetical protein